MTDFPTETTLPAVMTRVQKRGFSPSAIINIGAGRGDDAPWFRRRFPEAKQLLIDADPQFEAGYREIIKADPLTSYEICYAGSEDRMVRAEKSGTVGGVVLKDSGAEVAMHTVDTLTKIHDLSGPYFLRFDTNGAEPDILRGASATLRRAGLIMMEVYNFKLRFMDFKNLTFPQMAAHMEDLGFGVVDMCDPLFRKSDAVLWQLHLFFAPLNDPIFSTAKSGFTD